MGNVKLEKNTVQETLVFPLYGRAVCSRKYPTLFYDPISEQVIKKVDYDFGSMEWREHEIVAWALRQRMFCDMAKDYLTEHPEATIIDLGCGMATSFSSVDNGRCRWINLDLPEIIALREQLIPCGQREENLAADAFQLSWVERAGIDLQKGVYIISGGFFYYFRPEKIKLLFCNLSKVFPGGGICFDGESSFGIKMSNKAVEKNGNGSIMYFSVENPERLFRSWSERFKEIRVKNRLPKEIRTSGLLPLKVRLILKIGLDMGIIKFIEIRF